MTSGKAAARWCGPQSAGHAFACAIAFMIAAGSSRGDEPRMADFPLDWGRASGSAIDLSRFLDAPAGRDGFVRVEGAHLVKPDGSRLRFWGVNLTAMNCSPSHDDADILADDLARLGFNIVRFHHMDSTWSGMFPRGSKSTRALDPKYLDGLDYLVAALKKRGIYSNINLNVGRQFREEDGVRDAEALGYGKSATYFNPRLIELQHEFARQLLTHRNPYTGNEYRHEPAVAIVEIVNENAVLEGWVGGRLQVDAPVSQHGDTWSPIPPSYANELTDQYNAWLPTHLSAVTLKAIRHEAGVGPNGAVPRLGPKEFNAASVERFGAEARFYRDLEKTFLEGMKRLLKDELGVKMTVIGTADHNDGYAAYLHIQSNLMFDVVDGHGYWEHPNLGAKTFIKNTPMVNDPTDSTVVQFARTPVVGRPYTISEVNHPFPHEYACEGFPILTAYALLHDWDGIMWFEWGKGHRYETKDGISPNGWFNLSADPMKRAAIASCAAMWHRRDVKAATRTIVRSYTEDQMVAALKLPERWTKRPFFTEGFARATPLQHATRFTLDPSIPATPFPPASSLARIVSDTGELVWQGADRKKGLVTVETANTEGLIGFVKDAGTGAALAHLTPSVDTDFCALMLTALDDRPIAGSGRMLLAATARSTNSEFAWEADRQTVASWGRGPTRIEPVRGTITLKGLDAAKAVRARSLTAIGALAETPPIIAEATPDGWRFPIGSTATTWYVVEVDRAQ